MTHAYYLLHIAPTFISTPPLLFMFHVSINKKINNKIIISSSSSYFRFVRTVSEAIPIMKELLSSMDGS
jgi:hypothetical protein